MKTLLNLLLACCLFINVNAQNKKTYFPTWSFHQPNATINGISVGIASGFKEGKTTTTNGLRLELIGMGLLTPLLPYYPFEDDDSTTIPSDSLAEIINGINLSASGTVAECTINGFSAGFIGGVVYKVNGVSTNFFINLAKIHNGLQFAFMCSGNQKMNGLQLSAINQSNDTKGVQIGVINRSADLRGVQIGLWNKNGKRSLPIINWQFKKARQKIISNTQAC